MFHRFRNHMQHLFNPLHLFCRLRALGFTVRAARRVCTGYERRVYRHFG